MIDPHNYGRYYGNIITDVDGFSAWWTKIASRFACNALVIFDTNNEYHTMENSLVHDLNQAAIDAIRAAGATSQWIWVEGNAWSGAWSGSFKERFPSQNGVYGERPSEQHPIRTRKSCSTRRCGGLLVEW